MLCREGESFGSPIFHLMVGGVLGERALRYRKIRLTTSAVHEIPGSSRMIIRDTDENAIVLRFTAISSIRSSAQGTTEVCGEERFDTNSPPS
jgi:hypothetical protein